MNIIMNIDSTTRSLKDLNLKEDKDFKIQLRSLCGQYVSIHYDKVYFLHQTAHEFLIAHLLLATSGTLSPQW